MLQEVENQKLRGELQAAKIQLAAMAAIQHQHSDSPDAGDELLAVWRLEDWQNDETGTWCLLDHAADAVYQQEKGSHAWPHPIGVRESGSDNKRPCHAMSELMRLVNSALHSEDWNRCGLPGCCLHGCAHSRAPAW